MQTYICLQIFNSIRAHLGGAHVYRKCSARTPIQLNNNTILDTTNNCLARSHITPDQPFSQDFIFRLRTGLFFHPSVKFAPGAVLLTTAQDKAMCWGPLVLLLCGNRKGSPSFFIRNSLQNPKKGLYGWCSVTDAPQFCSEWLILPEANISCQIHHKLTVQQF